MALQLVAIEHINLVQPMTLEQANASGWKHPLCDDGSHRILIAPHEDVRELTRMADGVYATSGRTLACTMGSHKDVLAWLERLADMMEFPISHVWRGDVPDAFGALFEHSECNGTMSAAVCARLTKDFNSWQERADDFRPHGHWDGSWHETYSDLKALLELAATNGAVVWQ